MIKTQFNLHMAGMMRLVFQESSRAFLKMLSQFFKYANENCLRINPKLDVDIEHGNVIVIYC